MNNKVSVKNNITRRSITEKALWATPVIIGSIAAPTAQASIKTVYQLSNSSDYTSYEMSGKWNSVFTLMVSINGEKFQPAIGQTVHLSMGPTETTDQGGFGPAPENATNMTSSEVLITNSEGNVFPQGSYSVPGFGYRTVTRLTAVAQGIPSSLNIIVDLTT